MCQLSHSTLPHVFSKVEGFSLVLFVAFCQKVFVTANNDKPRTELVGTVIFKLEEISTQIRIQQYLFGGGVRPFLPPTELGSGSVPIFF